MCCNKVSGNLECGNILDDVLLVQRKYVYMYWAAPRRPGRINKFACFSTICSSFMVKPRSASTLLNCSIKSKNLKKPQYFVIVTSSPSPGFWYEINISRSNGVMLTKMFTVLWDLQSNQVLVSQKKSYDYFYDVIKPFSRRRRFHLKKNIVRPFLRQKFQVHAVSCESVDIRRLCFRVLVKFQDGDCRVMNLTQVIRKLFWLNNTLSVNNRHWIPYTIEIWTTSEDYKRIQLYWNIFGAYNHCISNQHFNT